GILSGASHTCTRCGGPVSVSPRPRFGGEGLGARGRATPPHPPPLSPAYMGEGRTADHRTGSGSKAAPRRGTMMKRRCGVVLGGLVLAAPAARAAEWQTTTEELLRAEKPGFGGLCGIVVDHQTGDVLVNVSDRGFFRSTDQGKSWKRLGAELKGRTEWPGCLQLDPTGKTKVVASALVYGSPIVVSADRAGMWAALGKKCRPSHWFALPSPA